MYNRRNDIAIKYAMPDVIVKYEEFKPLINIRMKSS